MIHDHVFLCPVAKVPSATYMTLEGHSPMMTVPSNSTMEDATAAVRDTSHRIIHTVIPGQWEIAKLCELSIESVTIDRIVGRKASRRVEGRLSPADFVIKWPFVVTNIVTNPMGSLHGGVSAYLIDQLSTLHAVMLTPQHASIDVHLTYLHSLPLGMKGTVATRVERIGGRVLFMAAEILDDQERVCVRGAVTKSIGTTAAKL